MYVIDSEGGVTWVKIYPVDAKRGSRTEQTARTDVIPAAVPSIVFSAKKKILHQLGGGWLRKKLDQSLEIEILTAGFAPSEDTILVANH